MSFEQELAIVFAKVDGMQGDACAAFLDRLGQLEEDLKNGDISSFLYAATLLLKAYTDSSPAYAHALRTCAARLTVGKTRLTFKRLDVKRSNSNELLQDDYYDTTIKSECSETETAFETDLKKLPLAGQELITRWNEILSLPRILSLEGRVKVIRKAFQSSFFKTYWEDGLIKLARSKFLTGHGSKRWKANIDWFLTPPNLQNIIAGQYDDNKSSTSTQPKKYDSTEI